LLPGFTLDQRVVSSRGQEVGWEPRHRNVLEEIAGEYDAWKASLPDRGPE
jgi:hypothetical protein